MQERVLCYHGPLIYEAKVLKTDTWDETTTKLGSVGVHYYVHYKGWKQTWDEWVPASRLLKFNDTNLALQKTLIAAQKATTAPAKTSTSSGTIGSSLTGRRDGGRKDGRKRGREEDDFSKKPDLKLVIPDVLKVVLVDDWEAVTKGNQLVSLPRKPNVQEILSQFKEHVLSLPSPPPQAQTILPTLLTGLQTYFDRSLGTSLLYRFERAQYATSRRNWVTGPHVVVGEEKEMSAVYGAEHLCRLLVNLPTMISHTTMDQESVNILRDYVTQLMDFLVEKKDTIFLHDYESASSQYQNLSRT